MKTHAGCCRGTKGGHKPELNDRKKSLILSLKAIAEFVK